MSSNLTRTTNPGSRTVQVTIHGCTNLSSDETLGWAKKTPSYFAKVTIGGVNQQTAECEVDEDSQTVTWNQTFTFHRVTSSSMTLRVYRRRTLREAKLVEKLSVELRDDNDTAPSALIRVVSFEAGPKIEFSLQVGKMDFPERVVQQNQDSRATDASGEESGREDNQKRQEAVTKAKLALESQGTPKALLRRVLEGIEAFHDIAGPIAEVHPYAQLALAILFSLPAPLLEQLDRDEQVQSLLDSFADFCATVNRCKDSELGKDESLRDVLKRASVQLVEVSYFVQGYCKDTSFLKRALKNKVSGVDDTIEGYCTKLDGLKEEFSLGLAIATGATAVRTEMITSRTETIVARTELMAARTEAIVTRTEVKVMLIFNRVEELAQSARLDDIAYILGAGLDTDKMCMPGTRVEILDWITQWASLDGSRVLLLSGGAGTGKSSIAHAIAARFKEMGRLGSMFCFNASEQASRKPSSLFPHIARDLADLHPSIQAELCKATEKKADRTASGITVQFEKLVLTPANAIKEHLHGPVIVVIDALDESGTVEERRKLVEVLSLRLEQLPENFRIIITSRPARDIEQKFKKGASVVIKRMEDIPSATTGVDIAKFVDSHLADDPEVGVEIRQNLAVQARDLFQWAYVACQFIRDRKPEESASARYEAIAPPLTKNATSSLNPTPIDATEYTRLDRLYRTVLSEALTSKGNVPIDHFKFVMSRILVAFEPLSCKSLNRIIAASKSAPSGCAVEQVVASLGSLLSGVDDYDIPIAILHTSFRDFLSDVGRSGEFFVDLNDPAVHSDMASASLLIMEEELRFNICDLPTSYLANKDIPGLEELIRARITPHLAYACQYWASHFCSIPPTRDEWVELTKKVQELVEVRVLFWLEVLSLLGASEKGLREMRRMYSLVKAENKGDEDLVFLLQDLEQFWSYFAKCISESAAHIYVSALPFAPKDSLISRKYTSPNDNRLSLRAGQPEKYPSCLNVLQGHTSLVTSVAFSPDGTRIISGSSDATIRVWDSETGELVFDPLKGHERAINSVAISPEGTRLVSGSSDETIRIWDAENGAMLADLSVDHVDSVTCVAFSPDGTRIASSSFDRTVRVWSAENGQRILGLLKSGYIVSLTFSPDGTRIISICDSGAIRIWDGENSKMSLGPLLGHTSSAAFSPDGIRIASSCQDKTIRFWNVETGEAALGQLEGHTDSITSIAFSPDGTHIVSGSKDRTIRIWNAETGEMVLGPLQGHTDRITSVAFSPDGTRVVSGSWDQTIRIWNAEIPPGEFKSQGCWITSATYSLDRNHAVSGSSDGTIRIWSTENGEMVFSPFKHHTSSISSVTLSPNGDYVASGTIDGTIQMWNAEYGEIILEPLQGHWDLVSSVTFSPDGTHIVSGSHDNTIRIWNVENGDMLLGPLSDHTDSVNSVFFSPDGSRIISGSSDKTVRIWSAESGEADLEPLYHDEGVTTIAVSPDGTRIASGTEGGDIAIWNATNGERVRTISNSLFPTSYRSFKENIQICNAGNDNLASAPWEGTSPECVTSLSFSPDGSHIISGFANGSIRIFNVEHDGMAIALRGHVYPVISVTFSLDGTRVISSSYDNTVRVWNIENAEKDAILLRGHSEQVNSAAFSPDGTHIVSGSGDETVRFWNAENGEVVLGPLRGHFDTITSIAFSPDGTHIISGSGDETIQIWNTENGEMTLAPLQGHTDPVTSVAFSPDGTRIISGSEDNTIRIWVAENGNMVLGPLYGHSRSVRSVAFSPDGTLIISGSEDYTIRIWDAENGEMVLWPLQGHDGWVNSVAFSPDGTRIISGSNDCTIRIWDPENGRMVLRPLQGHTVSVESVAFSPDGARIISGSADGTIRIWNAENGSMALGPLHGHSLWVNSVAFSPDGTRFLSGSRDRTIRIWNLKTTKSLAIGPIPSNSPTPSQASARTIGDVVETVFSTADPTYYIQIQDDWKMEDSWVVGVNGELLFYVPPVHRSRLCGWRTLFVIDLSELSTVLDISQFAHGSRWTECFNYRA